MILVAGEALIDLIERAPGQFDAVPGGGAANAAIGLARQGLDSRLLARISIDGFGDQLRAHLTDGGVDLGFARTANEPSTLAVATLSEEGSARYAFYLNGTADWQWTTEELPTPVPPSARFAHFGTLSMTIGPGNAVLETFMTGCRNAGVITSFDLNIRPSIGVSRDDEVRRVERQSALADIVKASEEDLNWLYPDLSRDDAARELLIAPGTLVVITLGSEGSLLLRENQETLWHPSRETRVVDTVGAGDAFCAGLIAALDERLGPDARNALRELDDATLLECLEWAGTTASLTCERKGAQPPSRAEVAAALGR